MSPHLERLKNGLAQLIVDDQPFLMRPAELNNSSLSSPEYMKEAWPRLVENNVNTVLGVVSWDQIEPDEGEFNFGVLDKIVYGARQHGLRLVLLWFGAFKNGALDPTIRTEL
jgi:beta-galactosidase GanA